MIDVQLIPVLSDNYSYILTSNNDIAVIVPGDGLAMLHALQSRNLKPAKIFITHHHSDHIAGIAALKQAYNCIVFGPAAETNKIPGLDRLLNDGESVTLGGEELRVIATPGHTLGHIAFWAPQSGMLFCGDTLFSLGCGRLFEGTAEQMFASLERLKDLPDDTQIYCGHEYTASNAKFCQSLAPDDKGLKDKIALISKQRANSMPTIPTTLAEEKKLNPFLQCKNAEAFAALRRLKDNF